MSLVTLLNRWSPREREPHSVIKLFSTLTVRELRNIVTVLHHRSYLEGEVVFDEGEVGRAMYFVLDGGVTIQRTLADGHRALAQIGKGEAFGTLALLVDEPRVAQAVARTDCRLAILFRSELQQLLDTRVAAASKLSLELARHLAHFLRSVALHGDQPLEI